MKNIDLGETKLSLLSEEEASAFNGGCWSWWCTGKVVGALSDFWDGMGEGFYDGFAKGSR